MKMPAGFGPQGRRLWKSIVDRFDFDAPHEAVLLERACRVADTIAALENRLGDELVAIDGRIRPELVEIRLQGQQLARLLVALRVPERDLAGNWRRPQRRGPRGLYALDGEGAS